MKTELDFTHTLKHLVSEHGCELMAERLGLTRAAVRQMLNADRQIYVKKIRGKWCYAEIKPYKHARNFIKKRDTRARSWKVGDASGKPIVRRRATPKRRTATPAAVMNKPKTASTAHA